MRIRAELTRRARRAMERRLEMAKDVVVFERGGEQEQQVEDDAEENRALPLPCLEGHQI